MQLPKMRVHTLILATLVLAAVSARPAAAQKPLDAPPSTREEPDSVYLLTTFSGGISLGSYQAGVNWTMLEVLRDSAMVRRWRLPHYRFGTAAGASAGNINAVLWAVETCTRSDSIAPPERSLFWSTWVDVGLDSLLRPYVSGSERALLDRRATEFVENRIRDRMRSSKLVAECSIPIGITLTRAVPDIVSYKGLSIRAQRTVTALRMEVVDSPGGPGKRTDAEGKTAAPSPPAHTGRRLVFRVPEIRGSDTKRMGPTRLAGTANDTVNSAVVFSIVRASSSFPIAFQPMDLRLLDPRVQGPGRRETFLDGGFFDNNPMDLALQLHELEARAGRVDSAHRRVMLYVDPDNRRPAQPPRAPNPLAVPGGLRPILTVLGGAVTSAREYELFALSRLGPGAGLSADSLLTTRRFPVVGERMGAFGAFLSQAFREYDFYVGVYDAAHALLCQVARPGVDCTRPQPELADSVIAVLDGLPLPASARHLVRELAGEEFGVPALRGAPLPEDPAEAARAAAYLAILTASNRTTTAAGPRTSEMCGSIPGALLCADSTHLFLTTLAAELKRADPDALRCRGGAGPAGEAWRRLELCSVASGDPDLYMAQLLDLILARMPAVERAVVEEERRQHLAGRDSAARFSPNHTPEVVTEALAFVYYSTGLRPRQGFEMGNLPPGAARRWNAIPGYLAFDADWNGLEIGYTPTWYPRGYRAAGIQMPVVLRWNDPPGRDDADLSPCDDDDTSPRCWIGVGAQFVIRPSDIRTALLVSRITFGGMVFQAIGNGFGMDVAAGPEVSVGLLADRVRLGVRCTPFQSQRLDGRGDCGIMLGLSDLSGWVYWTTEFMGH